MNKRNPNFVPREEKILLAIVKKYSAIIENKKTDKITSNQKLKCWHKIEVEFNSHTNVHFRNSSNLKNKYENIKKATKRRFSANKQYLIDAGGGSALAQDKIDENENDLIDILRPQVTTGLPHECDDDPLTEKSCNRNEMPIVVIEDKGKRRSTSIEMLSPIEEAGPSQIERNIRLIQEDWDTCNSTKFKEPKTTLLRHRSQDEISQWTEEKTKILHTQKLRNKRIFNRNMRHLEEMHWLKIKLMKERHQKEVEILENESSLRQQLMREEHNLRMMKFVQNLKTAKD
ncbi:myb/SANT-like DNA-binding domain-containing protein 3 [Halyomorpha halys]|uniref:myb/SANT-like DNA-binding domain-containing protein 3 n=1 Tax=Halyomorpha halys TaxID=286706 RepID=UPI0006D4DF04|nr:uncharacterized protein LOC106682415 [Halyomorpha halys]